MISDTVLRKIVNDSRIVTPETFYSNFSNILKSVKKISVTAFECCHMLQIEYNLAILITIFS